MFTPQQMYVALGRATDEHGVQLLNSRTSLCRSPDVDVVNICRRTSCDINPDLLCCTNPHPSCATVPNAPVSEIDLSADDIEDEESPKAWELFSAQDISTIDALESTESHASQYTFISDVDMT